jgi:hypothetical protein
MRLDTLPKGIAVTGARSVGMTFDPRRAMRNTGNSLPADEVLALLRTD